MGENATPEETLLRERVDEVLYYLWDPSGVVGLPGGRNEYDAYIPAVFKRVKDGASVAEIAEYLLKIETRSMGLPGHRERAERVGEVLVDYRDSMPEETHSG